MFISESLESYRCKSMVSLLLSSELSLSVDCNFPIMINQCPHSKFIIRLLIFNFCNLPKLIYFKTNSTKTSGFFLLNVRYTFSSYSSNICDASESLWVYILPRNPYFSQFPTGLAHEENISQTPLK